MKICIDTDDKYFHCTALCDEGSVNGHGLMAMLTAVNGTYKPVLTGLDFIDNSSNSLTVTDSFMDNLNYLEYDRKKCVLSLTDDVEYNNCSFKSLFHFCPFMHLLNCPLHDLSNSASDLYQNKIMDDVYECIREGPKIFTNSPANKSSWKSYARTLTFKNDQLIDDFVQYLDITDIRDIYGIPAQIDDETIQKRVREMKTRLNSNENANSNSIPSRHKKIDDYLPNVVLERYPYRLIDN